MNRARFKFILYFLGFIAAALTAYFLIFHIVGFKKIVTVPLLKGRSVSEAIGLLEGKGLYLEVEGEGDDPAIPQDYVISQDMKEGEKVEKGTGVRVVISSRKSGNAIPFLEGMDINDVRLTLKESGMEIGKITLVHSDTVGRDRVITQRPLSGHFNDSKVNLVVSLGPYIVSYKCPSFVNLTIEEARSLSNTLGLKLAESDEGMVIVFQKPEAGAIVKRGDVIEVKLGQGGGFWF